MVTTEPARPPRTPTFFLYRRPERPWQLDDMFASASLLENVESFVVGDPNEWLAVSDHLPVVVVIRP